MRKLWRELQAFRRWRRRTVYMRWEVLPGSVIQWREPWVSRDAIQMSNPDLKRPMRIEVYYP